MSAVSSPHTLGRGLLTVNVFMLMLFVENVTVVVSVVATCKMSASFQHQQCPSLPGVTVSEAIVIAAVVEEIACTVDVEVTVVLGAPVAIQGQNADTGVTALLALSGTTEDS